MEIKTTTSSITKIMQLLTWIVFIGVCIESGAILYSFFVSQCINPLAAKNLYMGLDLSGLKVFSSVHYSIMVLLIIGTLSLKAYIFYLATTVFSKINFTQPFSENMALLITKISSVAFIIGILILGANEYYKRLIKEEVSLHTLQSYIIGGPEFLFLAGMVFIISIVFKKGIEIQSENDLTV
jgi:hypothetical protein